MSVDKRTPVPLSQTTTLDISTQDAYFDKSYPNYEQKVVELKEV
jgi:hypothetical protein